MEFVGVKCAFGKHVLRFPRPAFVPFFFFKCLLHCSWDMNSAFRHVNNATRMSSNFFIIFLLFSDFNKINDIQTHPKSQYGVRV